MAEQVRRPLEGHGVRPTTPKPTPGRWVVKRDAQTGRFTDVKVDKAPFKGVTKEPTKRK
jgi:hypothetical protein